MLTSTTPEGQRQEADEWLTSREAAALTKYSPQTLANHRHLGIGIPYVKLSSGRIRYRRTAVERHLSGQTAEAA